MLDKTLRIIENVKFGLVFIYLTLVHFVAIAQAPTHVPRDRQEPVAFFESWENIVFYIVVPLVIVILYFLWKKETAKKKKREEEERKSE